MADRRSNGRHATNGTMVSGPPPPTNSVSDTIEHNKLRPHLPSTSVPAAYRHPTASADIHVPRHAERFASVNDNRSSVIESTTPVNGDGQVSAANIPTSTSIPPPPQPPVYPAASSSSPTAISSGYTMPPRAKHRSHIDTIPAAVPPGAPAVDPVPSAYPVVRNGHSPSAVSPRDPVFPRNDVAGYPHGYPPEPQSHIYPAPGAHYPANAPYYHPSDRKGYYPTENGSHRAVNGVNGNGLNGNHFVSFHLDQFATAVLDGTLGTEYPLTPSDSVSPTDQRHAHLFHHSAPSHVKRHAHIPLPHQFYSGIGAHHHRPNSFVPRPNGHLTRENGYTSSSGSSVASNESRHARLENDQMNYLPVSTGAGIIPPPDRSHRVEGGDYNIPIDHSRINHHHHGMQYSHSSSTRHHHHRHAHMTHHLHVHSAVTADKRDGYVEVPPLSDEPSEHSMYHPHKREPASLSHGYQFATGDLHYAQHKKSRKHPKSTAVVHDMPPLPPYPAHPSYPTYPSTVPHSKHAPSMMPVHMPVHPSSVLPHYPNSATSSNSSSRSISPDYPAVSSAKSGKKVTHFPQVNKSGKSSKSEDPSKSSKKIVVSPLMSLLQAQETLISPPCIRQSLYPTLSDRDSLFEQTMFAIAKICEGKLYRAKALTLEDYFKSEWSVSRAQVYRFLSCARVLKDLQTFPQRPTKERICRILRQLTSTTTELKSLWAAILKKFDGDLSNLSTNDVTDLWGEVKLKLDREGASSPHCVEDRPRNGHDGVTDGDDFNFMEGVSDGFDSTTENHDGSEYSRQRSNHSGQTEQRKRKNTSSQSSIEDVSGGNYSRHLDSNGADGPMPKRAKISPSRETSPREPRQSSPNSEPSSHMHRQNSSMPPTSSVSPHLSPVDALRAIPLPSSGLASGDAEPNPQEYLRYTIEMIQYLSRMGFSLQPLVNGEWVGSCENWRFVKTGKSKRQQTEPSSSSHHSSIPASPRPIDSHSCTENNVVFDQDTGVETSKDSVDSNGSNTDSGCVTTASETSNESVDKSKINDRMDIDEDGNPPLNDTIPDRAAVEVAAE